MVAKITFFPVGNGDMTLIETDNNKKILIDCRIRKGEDYPDVLKQLKEKLTSDSQGRLYIDLLIWSHPDEDHCQGIKDNFHLDTPETWDKEKNLIFINGIWSSPLVYRRASNNHKLCQDAKALNTEIKRRVNFFKQNKFQNDGNGVLILGEDENGKTDEILDIVLKLDSQTSKINNDEDSSFLANLLAPSPKSEIDEDEENLGKNHSSVIMNYQLTCGNTSANFLSGGDAEVICWETLHTRLLNTKRISDLEYDILQAPHHCSWHCLSHDSLSQKKERAATSPEALEALSQAKQNAFIIASSQKIEDNDVDPPAFRAKIEYEKIVDNVNGTFKCVDDHKKNDKNIPLEIEISSNGIKALAVSSLSQSNRASESSVNRKGGDGYA
ncbi:hypothetical protein H8K52_06450 [Undibacterium seohonense]|uniref:Metallohydrolase n=1 Tax=Undibacterium seohonense TaxID=1344950 RepID=A0ABR6X2A9_9BURK|nr:hypothetical protein [Undibacterium seohonense]MBC3806985.1 hypothetical protein [Undibacterium seohonense]